MVAVAVMVLARAAAIVLAIDKTIVFKLRHRTATEAPTCVMPRRIATLLKTATGIAAPAADPAAPAAAASTAAATAATASATADATASATADALLLLLLLRPLLLLRLLLLLLLLLVRGDRSLITHTRP